MNTFSPKDSWLVMLNGGAGTRLRPFTLTSSKGLMPLFNYNPMSEFILFGFAKQLGMRKAILSSYGYNNYVETKSYFEGGSGWSAKLGLEPEMEFEYHDLHYQDFGSADGVSHSLKKFSIDTPIVVVSNDNLYSMDDVGKLFTFAMNSPFDFCIGLTEVADPCQYGIASLKNNGQIEKFVEKPEKSRAPSNLASGAVYVIKPSAFPFLGLDFGKNVIPNLVAQGRVGGVVFEKPWLDFGKNDLYLQSFLHLLRDPFPFVDDFLKRTYQQVPNTDVWIRGGGEISKKFAEKIGQGLVQGSLRVAGRVFLGKECVIEDGVHLEDCSIGDYGLVRKNAHISQSNLFDAVSVGEKTTITKSVIGRGGEVGPHLDLVDQFVGHGEKL